MYSKKTERILIKFLDDEFMGDIFLFVFNYFQIFLRWMYIGNQENILKEAVHILLKRLENTES